MSRRVAAGCVAALAAGCTTFEDPQVVLDLRVLAMTTSPPEQVVEISLDDAPSPSELLAQLVPTTICALVADPGAQRDLRWAMTVCLTDDDGRCDPGHAQFELGAGEILDPEEAAYLQQPCAEVYPDQRLLGVMLDAFEHDPLRGLGGLDYTVVMQLQAAHDPTIDTVFAAKHVRVSPRIPDHRLANTNPRIEYLEGSVDSLTVQVPSQRCHDGTFTEVPTGELLTLYPVEPMMVREDYATPTLDGQIVELTETITYWWYAGMGSFADETTGGGHDLLGNQALLGTQWRAPRVAEPTEVPLWMVQRDERLGVSWYETCMLVIP